MTRQMYSERDMKIGGNGNTQLENNDCDQSVSEVAWSTTWCNSMGARKSKN